MSRSATDALSTALLAGTGALPPPPAAGPADALVDPDLPPERALLLRVGARTLAERAAPVLPTATPAEPCPPEELSAPPPGAARLLAPLLGGGAGAAFAAAPAGHADELLGEVAGLLARRGHHLPPALLPAALARLTEAPALAPALAPLLGTRGRWLVEHHAAALPATPKPALPGPLDAGSAATLPALRATWESAAGRGRPAALTAAREVDPAAALAWLEADLSREGAPARAALVAALATGLSPADAPFLEGVAATDRSAPVRAAATELLLRLPGTTPATRLLARATTLLALTDGRLELNFPPSPPPADDDLPDVAAPAGPGAAPTAWRPRYLTELLARVPLSTLAAALAAPVERLLDATLRHEHAPAAFLAWFRAAPTLGTPATLDALLARWPALPVGRRPMFPVEHAARTLPAPLLERRLVAILDTAPASTAAVLGALPGPWSPALSTRALAHARRRLADERRATADLLEFLPFLPRLAARVHPTLLAAARADWPLAPGGPAARAWDTAVRTLDATVRLRADIYALLEPAP